MMAAFPPKLRSQINKGIKNGLTWDIGGPSLLPAFYKNLFPKHADLGSPVHSFNFFKTIFSVFPGRAFICVIYHKGTPAAAGFVFRFKNRLFNPWASSLKQFRSLNTNMLLYWQMIRLACDLYLDTFDMGRSSKGAPTFRFKQQWGPKLTPLSWYTLTGERHKGAGRNPLHQYLEKNCHSGSPTWQALGSENTFHYRRGTQSNAPLHSHAIAGHHR